MLRGIGLIVSLLAASCSAQTMLPPAGTLPQFATLAALQASHPNCDIDAAIVVSSPAGQQLYTCSGSGVWTQQAGGGGSGITLQNSGVTTGNGLTTLNVQPDASTIVTTSAGGGVGNVRYSINTATIPNIAASQAGLATVVDTGASGTAYAGCPTTTITTLTDGMAVTLIPVHAATGGATTFNLCTLGTVSVLGWGVSNPASNDLLVNRPIILRYHSSFSGGAWVYTPDGNAPSGSGAPAPLFGAYATRPACASGNTGQTFTATEVSNKYWACDGTTWQPVAFGMQVVEPTGLTWATMVGAGPDTPTITNVGGAVQLSGTSSSTVDGYNFQGMLTPISISTPYTIEVAFTMDEMASAYSICQWGVSDGNSPASSFLGPGWQVNFGAALQMVFDGTFNSIGGAGRGRGGSYLTAQPVIRSKMVDDGTNRQWYFNTGGGYQLLFSESDTLDISPASDWGIGCTTYLTGEQFQLTLYHASVHH